MGPKSKKVLKKKCFLSKFHLFLWFFRAKITFDHTLHGSCPIFHVNSLYISSAYWHNMLISFKIRHLEALWRLTSPRILHFREIYHELWINVKNPLSSLNHPKLNFCGCKCDILSKHFMKKTLEAFLTMYNT